MYSLKTLQGIFILIDNKILIFFFHCHFRPDPKIITGIISRFFGTAMMEEGPNKLILWKNIYNFF